MRHLALILATALLLAACGTKGPLTQLPKPAKPTTTTPAADARAGDASTKPEADR